MGAGGTPFRGSDRANTRWGFGATHKEIRYVSETTHHRLLLHILTQPQAKNPVTAPPNTIRSVHMLPPAVLWFVMSPKVKVVLVQEANRCGAREENEDHPKRCHYEPEQVSD